MSDLEYDATLTDFLATVVANFPHRPATYFGGETLSYAELDARIAAAAGALREMGIRPGDRVALVLPNSPQHLIAFFAVLRLGAVVVEEASAWVSVTPLLLALSATGKPMILSTGAAEIDELRRREHAAPALQRWPQSVEHPGDRHDLPLDAVDGPLDAGRDDGRFGER